MTDKEFNISPVEVEDSVLKQEENSRSLKFRPVTNDTISKKYRDWREQNRTPKEVKKDIEKAVAFSNSLPESEVDMKAAVNEHILLLTSEYVFLETGSLESAQILGNRAIKLNESMKNGVDLNAKMIMAQVNQDIRDNNVKFAEPVSEEAQEDFGAMVNDEVQDDKVIDINDIPDTPEVQNNEEENNNDDLISEEVEGTPVEIPEEEPSIDEVEVSIEDPEAPVEEENVSMEDEEVELAEPSVNEEVEDNYEAVEDVESPEVEVSEAPVEEETYSDASAVDKIEDELSMAAKKLFEADERKERERERKERIQAERDELQEKKNQLIAKLREIDEENLAKINELISVREEEAAGFAREADEIEEERKTLEEFNNGHEDSVANRERSWQELFERASEEYSQAKRSK